MNTPTDSALAKRAGAVPALLTPDSAAMADDTPMGGLMAARPSDPSPVYGSAHAQCREHDAIRAERAAEHGNDDASIDPVCEMTVAIDSLHHVVHAGHEYRLFAAGCTVRNILRRNGL